MARFIEANLKPITLTADDAYIIESVKIHAGVHIGGEVLSAVKAILIYQRKSAPSALDCSHAYVEHLSDKARNSVQVSDGLIELIYERFYELKSVELAENGADREYGFNLADHVEDVDFATMLEYVLVYG